MLTPKMKKIADDIGKIIFSKYDQDYLNCLFSFGFRVEDIIFQVLVICCRYAYLVNSEKHPLLYYIEQEGLEPDRARKEYERIIKYVKEKDQLINDRLEENTGDRFLSPNTDLVRQNNRFPEYAFTAFQYWEIKNIHDMKLVKSVLERRISSSKKVPIDRFIAIAEEYDTAVEDMREQFGKNPDSTVFSSIQYFTLQTQYSFDFYYELAVKMEELKIKEFPDMYNRLMTVAGSYKCESVLPDMCPDFAADSDRKIMYPFIIQRRYYIDHIVSAPECSNFELTLAAFIEANVLANAVLSHMHIGGIRLPQLVAEETTVDDWVSVFEIFNVFRTFVPKKKWTDNRIKLVRKIYSLLSIDYKALKNPENRP